MTLLKSLHLLLFFVAPMNGLANWSANRATNIFTSMIMTQNIARTDAMRNKTLLILAFSNVLPKPLHACTMRSHRTVAIVVLTFCSMAQ